MFYIKPADANKLKCPLASKESDNWCLGSKCMAWRWEPDYIEYDTRGYKIPASEPKEIIAYSTEYGYCGMVSKP